MKNLFKLIVPEKKITQVLSACQILGIEVVKNSKVNSWELRLEKLKF